MNITKRFADRLFALGFPESPTGSSAVRPPRLWHRSRLPLTRRTGSRLPLARSLGKPPCRAKPSDSRPTPPFAERSSQTGKIRRNKIMASMFGIGIGSFMDGIERGKAAARAQAAADAATAQQAFTNNLATNQDQRAGAASQLALAQGQNNLDQSKTTFGNTQADYADNADLRKLQHDDKVTDITDQNETSAINTAAAANSDAAYNAAKAKSIFVGKDAQGNPTYSVDGQAVPSQEAAATLYDQTHANRMQTYYNVGGPKIVSDMLASGDTAGAEAFRKRTKTPISRRASTRWAAGGRGASR